MISFKTEPASQYFLVGLFFTSSFLLSSCSRYFASLSNKIFIYKQAYRPTVMIHFILVGFFRFQGSNVSFSSLIDERRMDISDVGLLSWNFFACILRRRK
ncbi:predicted protein [Listeria monocytogenes FSL N1-017]|nr:predicted protein [Listeria monocytogenes FSL N1-017]DAL82843.1 MAG TPA: hypothetical protein [Caudoviricetes sp.]